jgi:hypothetical protein
MADNDSHDRHRQRHPNRQIGQRLGAPEHVFGADESSAPQHDENHRRRARRKSLKITIHLLPSVPDHMLSGNYELRGAARCTARNRHHT